MKKYFSKLLALIAVMPLLVCMFACATESGTTGVHKVADKVIYGNVITMDGSDTVAEAVACKDGKIVYIGDVAGAKGYIGNGTEVLDYGKNCIYPGFLDAHEHGLLYGWRAQGQANLLDGQSYDDYVSIFREYIANNPGKDYYMASGWHVIGEPPAHELLDRVSADIPLIANSGDGHSMLLNGKAMEICGLDRNVVNDYAPGEIVVDGNGDSTGLINEEPVIRLMNNLPFVMDDVKNYILEWQRYAFAHGYVGGAECGDKLITSLQKQAYEELAKEGKLKFRTYSFATVDDNTDTPEEDVRTVFEEAKRSDSEFYRTIGFKVFLDGVLEAETSWMTDEYKNRPGYYGVSRFNDHDKMVRLISAASKYNMSVHAHSVGDGATKFMLDCIEDSQKETGNKGQRNALAHLQHVREQDFARFASTNTVAVTAPLWIMPVDFKTEADCIGSEKAMTDYPIGSFIKAGATTAFHSDFPAGFIMSAPGSIYMAQERVIDSKTAGLVGLSVILRCPEEKISAMDALLALTKNVAYLFHEEDRLGSIEVGKCADFSVFPCNFLTYKDSYLNVVGIEPVATIVNGDVVYQGNVAKM